VDVMKEKIAVSEAVRLGIPVFAIVDTNSNPRDIDFVIPANDDAKDSIEIVLSTCCQAIAEGLEERKVEKADEKAAAEQQAEDVEQKPKRTRRARKETTAEKKEVAEVATKEEVAATPVTEAADAPASSEDAPAEA